MKTKFLLLLLCLSPFIYSNDLYAQGLVDFLSIKNKYKSEIVQDASLLSINNQLYNQFLESELDSFKLIIPIDSVRTFTLSLKTNSILSNSFYVSTTDGHSTQQIQYNKGLYYKGIVEGEHNTLAAISFFENEIIGVIATDEGNFVIGLCGNTIPSLENNNSQTIGSHIIYNDANLLISNNFNCEVDSSSMLGSASTALSNTISGTSVSPISNVVDIYFECDYEMFLDKGANVINVSNYVTGLFNVVATIYANASLPINISQIQIWTTNDSYNSSSGYAALLDFGMNTQDYFNGDLAHLLSTSNNNNGGYAWIGALCANYNSPFSNHGPFAYSNIQLYYNNLPSYSWTTSVVSHEIGHNFGSRHTHDCIWNGNNTQIDDCGNQYDPGNAGSCYNSSSPTIPSSGTIMSYCHLVSGSSVNLNVGFYPQAQTVMQNHWQSSIPCANLSCGNPISSFFFPYTEDFSSASLCTSSSCVPNGFCKNALPSAGFFSAYDWTNGAKDDTDWLVSNIATPTSNTGPISGFGGSGNYLFVEGSNISCNQYSVYPPREAHLITPCIDLQLGSMSNTPKIGFAYHMYGSDIGTLFIDASDDNGMTWTSLASISGNQGNEWKQTYVCLNDYLNSIIHVRFRAILGNGEESDIAIDEISFGFFEPGSNIDTALLVSPLNSSLNVEIGGGIQFDFNHSYGMNISNPRIQISKIPPTGIPLDDFKENAWQCGDINLAYSSLPINTNSVMLTNGQGSFLWNQVDTTLGIYEVPQANTTYYWTIRYDVPTGSNIGYSYYTSPYQFTTYSLSYDLDSINHVVCKGDNTGNISLSVSGGQLPYSFSWNNGDTTEDLTSIFAGAYSCTITDAFGKAIQSESIAILEPADSLATQSVTVDVSCFGGSDGIVGVIPIGGTPPFNFNWNVSIIDSSVLNGIYNVMANIFIVTTEDGTNCVTTDTIVVNEPNEIQTSVSSTICHGSNYEGYSATGIHIDTLIGYNGCDSIRTIDLTVNPTQMTTLNEMICQGQSYTVGTSVYTTSATYTDILQTWQGCDSTVTLNLIINPTQITVIGTTICDNETFVAAGISHNTVGNYTYILQTWQGCDSTVTLDLIVNPTQITVIDTTICDNETFVAAGISHNTIGNYTYILQTWQGCDSTVTLNLIINPTQITVIDTTICDNETFVAAGISHNTVGNYTYILQTWQGCDSTVTLDLIVNPTQITVIDTTICDNETFVAAGISHNTIGNYTYILQTWQGCDSTVTLNLLVNPTQITVIDTIICDNETFIAAGVSHNVTGTYTYILQTYQGCDSTVTLNLLVNLTQSTVIDTIICDNETFVAGGVSHNVTGTYTYILQTYQGCDSTVTLNLLVNLTQITVIDTIICDNESFVAGGVSHNVTGTYIYTLQTWQGCDSTVTLNLTVNPTQITVIDTIICGNETFVAAGISHNTIGNYTYILQTWQGCDSMVTLNLTVNPTHLINQNFIICQGESILVGTIIHDSTGIYTDTLVNIYGCDSIVITDLNINPTQVTNLTDTICHGETLDFNGQIVDTSGTYQVTLQTWQGCDSIVNLDLTVQPSITILNTIIIDGTSIPLGSIDITPSGDTLTQQYLWSNGVTTQDVSSLGTGFYGLTITDNIGCQDTFSFEIGVVNTFFMDNKKQIQVKLYPNPTRENQITTLEFDNILSKDLTYRIVGVDGKILEVGVLSKNELKHQIKVPQVVGMYYLQLFSENRQIKAIPFIVR